jgi:secondary thiamine-phosphate synthase enzyme
MHQVDINLPPSRRGLHDVTGLIDEAIRASGVKTGLCHLFLQHTSASLVVQENADPAVLRDLETWMSEAVRDGDSRFEHHDEGPDDMSAHVRSALTHVDLTIPVRGGRLALGTWQALYLYEHRTRPHQRRLIATIWG